MSIFDTDFLLTKSNRVKFFHKFTKFTEPTLKKKSLFECDILYQKTNGNLVAYFLKILENKMLLLQDSNGDNKKLLDLREMYHLGSFLDYHQKRHSEYTYYISLEKSNHTRFMFIHDGQTLIRLMSILKNFCVLSNFNTTYEILEFIGSGHFAEVFSVKNKVTEQLFAAKIFQKQTEKFQKIQSFIVREIKILKFIPDCPFIIKLFEVYEEKDEIIMILELMEGQDLFKSIKAIQRPTEHQIYNIFSQMLKGMLFLNYHGIMHRDLKPDNILFTKDNKNARLKIADFSLAEEFSINKKFTVACGTPGFMAPEILSGEAYDEKIDVFSLGIILYMMFIGKPVFKGKNAKEILEKNKSGKISFKMYEWSAFSKDAKRLVRKMLMKDPAQRISMQDICTEKWIKKHQRVKTEQTVSVSTKTRLEDPQSLSNTLNNTANASKSLKNFSLFKNSFFGRSLNKSKTEILYTNKQIKYLLADYPEKELEILQEGDINKSKYDFGPKFFQKATNNHLQTIKERKSTYLLPLYSENYSINSFLICSKSDLKSNSSLQQNTLPSEEQYAKSVQSQMKKSSIDSSENFFLDPSPNSFEEFLKENKSSSLIFETKHEEHSITSFAKAFESRVESDLNLSKLVPSLLSITFKGKCF